MTFTLNRIAQLCPSERESVLKRFASVKRPRVKLSLIQRDVQDAITVLAIKRNAIFLTNTTMTKVKIHTDTRQANEKLASISLAVSGIQEVYNGLIEIGAESVSITDVKNVVTADSNPGVIREIILRGKSLQVGGIAIDPSFLKLPDDKIRELSRRARKVDPGNNLAWRHYDIQNGEVICRECVEKEIIERYTVYGSTTAAEIIEDVEKLCKVINSIGDKIGVDVSHPLRSPEAWFFWDNTQKMYRPDYTGLANTLSTYVKV